MKLKGIHGLYAFQKMGFMVIVNCPKSWYNPGRDYTAPICVRPGTAFHLQGFNSQIVPQVD